MNIPFGKHRGKPLDEIPLGYLRWVYRNCENCDPYLRAEIRRMLRAAEQERDDDDASQAIAIPSLAKRWYRQLSNEFHPDHGGSHDAMVAINRANDLLLDMAGVAS